MSKKLMAVFALCATAVTVPASAASFGDNFKQGVGVGVGLIVVQGVVCAISPQFAFGGVRACTSHQRASGQPYGQHRAHLLPSGYAAQYQQRQRVVVPGTEVQVGPTTVVVKGARHNADGSCNQSNGRRGVVTPRGCYVED